MQLTSLWGEQASLLLHSWLQFALLHEIAHISSHEPENETSGPEVEADVFAASSLGNVTVDGDVYIRNIIQLGMRMAGSMQSKVFR